MSYRSALLVIKSSIAVARVKTNLTASGRKVEMVFIRNRLSLLVMLACLSLLGAIGWQGMYGPRNVEFRKKLVEKAASAQVVLTKVSTERKAMEQRVALLRPGSIDADMVDEIARRDLNMGGKHDIIAHLSQ